MSSPIVQFPSGYVTGQAAAYVAPDGTAQLVSTATPLPVALGTGASVPVSVTSASTTPLTGSTISTGTLGPYKPVVGRSVMLTLTGDWSGSVQVTRSTDNGVTKIPLTIGGGSWALFTTNCCEAVWDESEAVATLYLSVTLTSGTLGYRLAQ